MAKSEAIHALVKSLNKNEKRLFTLQSSLGGSDQNYLKVFNALDKSETFDVGAFRKKLGNTKINISHEQNYLQKMILRSLRYYYSEQGVFAQLTESLRNAELLHNKKLNALNLEQLQKAKTLAEKYEYYVLLMELLDWENRVNSRMGNYNVIVESNALEKRSKLMADYFDWQQVYLLGVKTTLIISSKGSSLSAEDKTSLSEIVKESKKYLLKSKDSFRITEICLSVIYLSYSYIGEVNYALKYCKLLMDTYDRHPHFKEDLGFKYYSTSINLISRLINTKQYDEALRYIELLRHFLSGHKTFIGVELNTSVENLALHSLRIHALKGDYEKGMEVLLEYERNHKSRNGFLRPVMDIISNIFPARIYFGTGNFKKTLKCLTEIINYKERELPEDFVQYAYLLRLVTHFEMGNYDLLESLTQAAARLFKERWSGNSCGKIICAHLVQLLRTENRLQKKNSFISLVKELRAEEKKQVERIDYVDFIHWAEAKV